ncbi:MULTISPECIES: GntR family transcriptional regulator [Prauserella salsuginis group]|uniref:GntR family transcriptional regulator n=1 Tax=Prauserella salsuginis TaxID=387889 RepID=A0ABW6G9T5_9PSEU|nr:MULTISPECIES: GntR family transcriptional regulator [Prauserella salsuginis group]MCR3721447.1 DNA-binding transcriptional regulator, GntR family [Prauserella flava]MCR3732437.1 DNA-binding transcriptional regulator, GntR family [Prauserella salsuginis]
MIADIEPVNRESTAAIIARRLREAIMAGTLAPGTQLGEADLASRFQVSRGPLREAMQRLVSEGLLRSERHRGLFVIDLEPSDIQDIYTARSAVERAAATLVVHASDRDAIAAVLDEAVARMADADAQGDPTALSEADLQFHEALIEASGSPRLRRMARTLMIETRMCLTALQRTYPTDDYETDERIAEHHAIIAAVRAGDEPELLRLLDEHMADAVRRLAPGSGDDAADNA